MNIRKAKKEDIERLTDLLKKATNELEDKDKRLNEKELGIIAKNYIGKKNKCLFLAEKENKFFGYAFGNVERRTPKSQRFDYAKLIEIYIDKSYRKTGVAQELLERFYSWARTKGAEKVVLETELKNHRALSFWERQGYKETWKTMEKKL